MQVLFGDTVLIPAWNYDSSILEAWNAGKDFKITPNGPYCSIRDIKYLKDTSHMVFITKDYKEFTPV